MSVFHYKQKVQDPDESIEIWFGKIARNVGDIDEKCYITLPDYAPDQQLGPCFWQSRDATSLPARGDRCIVVFDNRGQLWVLAWWPYAL